MSPITDDEHVNELKERRRARESRPGSTRAAPARIPSAEPARDLLGGLITNAHRRVTRATPPALRTSRTTLWPPRERRPRSRMPVEREPSRLPPSAARRSMSSSDGSRRAHRQMPMSRRRSSGVARKARQIWPLRQRPDAGADPGRPSRQAGRRQGDGGLASSGSRQPSLSPGRPFSWSLSAAVPAG
jgi:hypothetical protein